MNPQQSLDRLCQLAGIAVEYQDAWGRSHRAAEDTKRALLAALQIPCATEDEVAAASDELEGRDWRQPLPPVLVLRQAELPAPVPITLPNAERSRRLRWTLTPEGGEAISGEVAADELARLDARRLGQAWFVRLALPLPVALGLGYHRFEVADADVGGEGGEGGAPLGAMSLIIVPARCYQPPALDGAGRVWGVQVQLYSLRSERNWGMGDLTDLYRLVELAARSGAGAVGVSPLHALFPDCPEHASPYGPSSRSQWNTLYLDVEAVPEFAECDEARRLVQGAEFQATLRALRGAELVDYGGVAAAKARVLEILFAHFRRHHLAPRSTRGRAFEAYCAEAGAALLGLARFEALQEHFRQADAAVWGWPVWPEEYRDPDAAAVAEFCTRHAERVQFRQYLQWEAERQLSRAGRRSWELGLGVGLYLDLAVGVDRGGAEVWTRRALYALAAGTGAPPDVINQQGQDWGLPPMNPQRLRDAAYEPFIAILRANMRHAGGLRIDHVMGLMRQFWVPQGRPAAAGAYVAYPFADLLGILALESQRNRCLVIGEDLGTVPGAVREAMGALGALSCRPLLLEHDASGGFPPAADYPVQALVSVGTHDLPTLRGYWLGRDLDLRAGLDLFPSAEVRERQVVERAQERARLLLALDREQLLPADAGVDPVTLPDMTAALCRAIHAYLARTTTGIMMVAPEDVLGEIEQMNLPGTTAERHPNWRRKLALNLENWRGDARVTALVAALQEARGAAVFPRVQRKLGAARTPQAKIPLATYRIQLNRHFTLAQATALVPYWHALGISHLYTSPYLKARAGSDHGYDITDHGSINPEVGDTAELARFAAALKSRGMGQIIDVVPNHMGVLGGDNPWWLDVLENGQASAYAGYFDIEWQPLKDDLRGKVLLPVLGAQYGRVLEGGELVLALDAARGELCLHYYQHRFPIDPRLYPRVLGRGIERLAARLGPEHPDTLDLLSLITAFGHLPAHTEIAPEQVAERARDKEIHKRRLAALVGRSADVALFLAENVAACNGTPGKPESWDELHALIKEQAWRLANWRVAADEINYRRFFDINDLAALRMESEAVFRDTHRLVLDWIKAGIADGVRVDHPDGLLDPGQYFRRLQRAAGGSETARPLYLVAEKILAGHEHLPHDWPVYGTTGYSFANLVNGLFVDAASERHLDRIYAAFSGEKQDFAEIARRAKKLVMRSAMAGELNVLASQLSRIASASRYTCDFTVNSLRDALGDIVAAFPVYRTYVTPAGVADDDRRHIDWAVALAKKKSRAADVSVFDFVRDALTGVLAAGKLPGYAERVFDFAMKFQQFTGPVAAKGVEDTGFYIYNRLVSLNEVGGDPRRFGVGVATFHRASQERALRWPHTLLATSTHDTKRSEDVRARIDVLSEMPLEWLQRLRRWRRLNRGKKLLVDARPAPSANDEYLFYQTLLGVWPLTAPDAAGRDRLRERIAAYMLKAVREAKVNSAWLNPDADYEKALAGFVADLLAGTGKHLFLDDFLPFQQRVARFGLFNSLSQTLLKIASPGVPDFYQGNELWDFSLVDPDNRRPVDYAVRQALLRDIASPPDRGGGELAAWARDLLEHMEDGRIKFYATWRGLHMRRQLPQLFQGGLYLPLRATGARAEHVCAFARRSARHAALVVAPRLFVRLMNGAPLPLGAAVWQDTRLELPAELAGMRFINVFTGEPGVLEEHEGKPSLPLAAALAHFPVALFCDAEPPPQR
ncbi:MAG: malto-oligosyltrehalose synthase [Rhodocyclaceae bacterium]|nr:malto-oligosyltrehalose synthase [Rhodocyclaceae bacterium]